MNQKRETTLKKYATFLKELHDLIIDTPQSIDTDAITRKHRIGKTVFYIAKDLGIVKKNDNKFYWSVGDPSLKMAEQIRKEMCRRQQISVEKKAQAYNFKFDEIHQPSLGGMAITVMPADYLERLERLEKEVVALKNGKAKKHFYFPKFKFQSPITIRS